MKIMLVSDVEPVFENFVTCVKKMGHMADFYPHHQALNEGLLITPDLLVVMDHNGFRAAEFIRKFRLAGHATLVLALVGEPSESLVVEALLAGADQVSRCDASHDEWAARVLALLRYGRSTTADRLTYRTLMIEPSTMTATRDEKVLPLIGKPFALLEFFIRNPDTVHSRERIGESVWDRNLDIFSNVIDVTVSKMRKCVDHEFPRPYIHTVVGSGYMLCDHAPGHAAAS